MVWSVDDDPLVLGRRIPRDLKSAYGVQTAVAFLPTAQRKFGHLGRFVLARTRLELYGYIVLFVWLVDTHATAQKVDRSDTRMRVADRHHLTFLATGTPPATKTSIKHPSQHLPVLPTRSQAPELEDDGRAQPHQPQGLIVRPPTVRIGRASLAGSRKGPSWRSGDRRCVALVWRTGLFFRLPGRVHGQAYSTTTLPPAAPVTSGCRAAPPLVQRLALVAPWRIAPSLAIDRAVDSEPLLVVDRVVAGMARGGTPVPPACLTRPFDPPVSPELTSSKLAATYRTVPRPPVDRTSPESRVLVHPVAPPIDPLDPPLPRVERMDLMAHDTQAHHQSFVNSDLLVVLNGPAASTTRSAVRLHRPESPYIRRQAIHR
ncbi:hypothetical protein FKP32DRAFT_1675083 [Trametes sanguinea]|nr:hypothetical protein FKP32DRAFT_1675083 [Trametes sanguinea]